MYLLSFLDKYNYNVLMKRFLVSAFMVIFLANTAIMPALAQPCVYNITPVSTIEMASMGDMPSCHPAVKQKLFDYENPHCEGSCLCAHTSNSSSAFLENAYIYPYVTSKQLFIIYNDKLTLINQNPPQRPPKYIS